MKYVILGKKLKTIWEVKDNRETIKNGDVIKKVFTAKPKLTSRVETFEHPEIMRFEGELGFNSTRSIFNYYNGAVGAAFNISADEEVIVEKKVFRADENLMYIYTNKVFEEVDENKESAELAYKNLLKEFNKAMIKSNPTMDNYCELHHLNYGLTDCFKLFEHLYPGKCWEIKEGKLIEKYSDLCVVNGEIAQTHSLFEIGQINKVVVSF